MPLRPTKAFLAAATLVTVAACSPSPNPGTPEPTTGTTTSSSDTLPIAGAPKVTKPLDTSKWQANPCSVLTNAQVTSLGLHATGKADNGGGSGPSCNWSQPEDLTKPNLGIGFVTANSIGLSSLFDKHQKGQMPILNTLPDIDGHPAVIYSSDPGAIQDGICFVAVGATDQVAVSADSNIADGPNKAHSGDVAMQLAKAMMDTMTGGS